MIYLLAIVAPALVLLYFGVQSFQRQRQAVDTLLRSNLRLSGEKLAGEIERRTMELARVCLEDEGRSEQRKSPAARYFFTIDRGIITFPVLHSPLPITVDELLVGVAPGMREQYGSLLLEAEQRELRDEKLEAAVEAYRKASELTVSDRLRALALSREARCLEKLNRGDAARQIYVVLGDQYGDVNDLSHRPYALLSAIALNAPDAKKSALWRDAAGGRWQLSAEQLDYFEPLLGGNTETGAYREQMRFARGLEEQFRHQGRLQPDKVYSFAFSGNGQHFQTFYRASALAEDRILGLAINPDWAREQAAAAGAQLVERGDAGDGRVRAAFPSMFPFWELALPPSAGNGTQSGLFFQASITALVLCLLLMGVLLLIRDLSRDARLNRVRSDFVGAVSHELKTPIAVIRLYGETLLDDDDFSPAQRRDMYQIITRESDRLTQLVDKVLAFSKIDRGEKQYHLQDADLAAVVTRTVATYEPYLKRRGYSVEIHLAEPLPPVRFDADAVSQALVNLLDNAAKYSGDAKSVAVRSYAANGCAVLEVEDHGIGIPREEQQKIFERFYRVRNAVAKGGYGLGLYLVRHTMDAHSGRVELDSEPLRGSRFRLIFPVAQSRSQT